MLQEYRQEGGEGCWREERLLRSVVLSCAFKDGEDLAG